MDDARATSEHERTTRWRPTTREFGLKTRKKFGEQIVKKKLGRAPR